MSFGGAGPGMAILMGVAQGVSNIDKRKREMEQEAIRNRLMQQQISSSEERMEIARDQEARLRENARAQARQNQQELQQAALEAAQKAEQSRLMTQELATEIMRQQPDLSEEDAYRIAHLDVQGIEDYGGPPKEPQPNVGMIKLGLDQQEQADFEAEMEKIYGNRPGRNQLQNAGTLDEAINVAQAFGFNEGAATQFWNDAGKGKMDSDEDLTPRTYPEMNAGERGSVDDDATLIIAKLLAEADEYLASHEGSNLDRWQLARAQIAEQKKQTIEKAREAGQALSDYQLATLDRLPFILYQMQQDDPYAGFTSMGPGLFRGG